MATLRSVLNDIASLPDVDQEKVLSALMSRLYCPPAGSRTDEEWLAEFQRRESEPTTDWETARGRMFRPRSE
jgi:hypothetical protein